MRATAGASGFDLHACFDHPDRTLTVKAQSSCAIGTGLSFEIPPGYEIQVRGRSGLAFRNSITAYLGTIDSDYRGEVKILLFNNLTHADFVVKHGERIAQAVVARVPEVEMEEVLILGETERGAGGFGHTGI